MLYQSDIASFFEQNSCDIGPRQYDREHGKIRPENDRRKF